MIRYKSKSEVELIRQSGKIVAEVLAHTKEMMLPGVSTWDINQMALHVIKSYNAIPSFLHYGNPPFPGAICCSLNDEVVHGIPDRKRLLKDGDLVSIDVGAKLEGFHSDAARTFTVGAVSLDIANLIRITEECFWKGLEKMKIGNRLGDVSAAIQRHAERYGYSVVRELTGHGIGRNLHEDPDLPNYGIEGRGLRIEEGLVIAIEPMINMGTRNINILSDEWTIVTVDGKPSSHYENTVVATKDGPLILTMSML